MAARGLTGRKVARKKPGDKRPARDRAVKVCEHIAGGLSLRKACEVEGVSHTTLLHMLPLDEDLRVLYEASRAAGIEARVSGLDDEVSKGMAVALKKGAGAGAYASLLGRKVAVTLWEAERLMPKKYGNRVSLDHSGSIDLAARLAAVRSRKPQE